MATPPLPHDFSEFLRLLNESGVRYLVVGGHAVGRTKDKLDLENLPD